MKRTLFLSPLLCCLIVVSCTSNKEAKNSEKSVVIDKNSDAYIISEAKNQLHIDSTETVKIQFFRAYLNTDSIQDAYVVINMAGRVQNDYENNKNPATFAEMGYFGKYNYIVPFDGATQRIGTPYMVGSNGKSELEITEHNWISPSYKIIQANYRVRNAGFAFFLTLNGNHLEPVFAYKRFDLIGEEKPVAFVIDTLSTPSSLSTDINLYEAEILNYDRGEALRNANSFTPQLKKTNKLVRHYFYVPSMKAYAAMREKK